MKKLMTTLCVLLGFSLYCNAQNITKANDAYVIQVLESSNNLDLQNETDQRAIFETNHINKAYWENAANIVATNPPISDQGIPIEELQTSIAYIIDVANSMNAKN